MAGSWGRSGGASVSSARTGGGRTTPSGQSAASPSVALERRMGRGRTLIWPLLSTGAPRTAGRFFYFRGVITGPRLTALLLAAPRASGNGVSAKLHQTLIQGSAAAPFSKGQRLRAKHPRPRNSSVPPRRP